MMIETLIEALQEYGLELNILKTKILSTVNNVDGQTQCATQYGMIDIRIRIRTPCASRGALAEKFK